MLQEIFDNIAWIGFLISLILTIIRWRKSYKTNEKKHPEFKRLFNFFSTYYLVFTSILSTIISIYLIISPILGLSWISITIDNVKYILIVGSLALLYLGFTKLKDEEI